MSELKYKRILLKLSGEALGSETGFGINVSEAEAIARRNPLGVVIGALGIGILIGLVKGRR